MKNAGKIEDPLTYKIIGCAMKVHSTMGNGFWYPVSKVHHDI